MKGSPERATRRAGNFVTRSDQEKLVTELVDALNDLLGTVYSCASFEYPEYDALIARARHQCCRADDD